MSNPYIIISIVSVVASAISVWITLRGQKITEEFNYVTMLEKRCADFEREIKRLELYNTDLLKERVILYQKLLKLNGGHETHH